MATAGSIVVDLLARTGSFETDMERAARASRRTGQEIAKSADGAASAWTKASKLMGLAVVGISGSMVLDGFIQNTIAAQNEQAQLTAVLRSTAEVAGFTQNQLNDMAESIVGILPTGEINNAQTALLAFTNVIGNEFARGLQAAVDMSARTGMSVVSAAETIGRALDVPSEGLSALSRQGFRFTEAEKAVVKQLELTGRTAEAQGIILRALEESYNGAAVAARDTLGGSFIALRNTASTLMTDGEGGLNGLRSVIEGLNEALGSDAAREGVQLLIVAAEGLAVVIGVRLASAVLTSAGSFVAAQISALRYQATLASMAGVSTTAAAGIIGLSTAARAASAAMALVGGPIGVATLALVAGAVAWANWGRETDNSIKSINAAQRSLKDLEKELASLSKTRQRGMLLSIESELREQEKSVKESLSSIRSELATLIDQGAMVGKSEHVEGFAAALNEIMRSSASAADKSDQLEAALARLKGAVPDDVVRKLQEVVQKISEGGESVDDLKQKLTSLRQEFEALANGAAPIASNLDSYKAAYDKFLDDFATPDERLKKAESQWREALGPLFDDDAQKRLRNRFLPRSTGATKQASELEGLIKRLVEQRDTLGMTTEAAERYRIEVAKGSAADRARALALYDEVHAWNETEKAMQSAIDSSRQYLAFQQELEVFQQKMGLEVASVGMSDRQRQIAEQELAIRQEYAQKRLDLEQAQQVASTALDQAQYQERLNLLHQFESSKLAAVQQTAKAVWEAESDWLLGAQRGLRNYAEEAANVSQMVGEASQGFLSKTEDSLISLATSGDLSFKSLARSFSSLASSVLSDLSRMVMRQGVTGPLAGMLGGLLTSAFSGLGGLKVGSGFDLGAGLGGGAGATFGPMLSLSSGGYTGPGGKFEPKGIVHAEEGVLNRDEVRALGGEAGFNRFRRALRGPGHYLGGMAGRPSLPPPGGQQQGFRPNIVINNNAPGIEIEERMSDGQITFEIDRRVKREVAQQIPKAVAREQADPNSRLSRQQARSLAVSRRR